MLVQGDVLVSIVKRQAVHWPGLASVGAGGPVHPDPPPRAHDAHVVLRVPGAGGDEPQEGGPQAPAEVVGAARVQDLEHDHVVLRPLPALPRPEHAGV